MRSRINLIPPYPRVIEHLRDAYDRTGRQTGLSFREYIGVRGYIDRSRHQIGLDDGIRTWMAERRARAAIAPIQGQLHVMVLLVQFPNRKGQLSKAHYEELLFSRGTLTPGSLADYLSEISYQNVDLTGEVHGWLDLPEDYSYYTNCESGTGDSYPRNAQKMAEDAVAQALQQGIGFKPKLDATGDGTVTALMIVHAGEDGADVIRPKNPGSEIWSHQWSLEQTVEVSKGLWATEYLTVNQSCSLGVCAHELGHLAFGWGDYYDTDSNDHDNWDGSGAWDLMAYGGFNRWQQDDVGTCPSHPAILHKVTHGWVPVQTLSQSKRVTLSPASAANPSCIRIVSPEYGPGQCLMLDCRQKSRFDSGLPGEGLLVWRVDESKKEMTTSKDARLFLVQADGRFDLNDPKDYNQGDSSDPFPGLYGVDTLSDIGAISTSFPGGNPSRVQLSNIKRASDGSVTLKVDFT